nr:hypothetical protein [Roseibium sp. TrichSKD4]
MDITDADVDGFVDLTVQPAHLQRKVLESAYTLVANLVLVSVKTGSQAAVSGSNVSAKSLEVLVAILQHALGGGRRN